MRYFQHIKSGDVHRLLDNFNIRGTIYSDSSLYVEVVVKPKPVPKTWTKKIALFKYIGGLRSNHTLPIDKNDYTSYIYNNYEQISEWQEVIFVEKTDETA